MALLKKRSTLGSAMPRKPRYIGGKEIPQNLYPHPRKEPNKWRYKRPDGSWYFFESSLEEAIAAADGLNQQFSTGLKLKPKTLPPVGRFSFARHVEDYIEDREKRDPGLVKKDSWVTRRFYLRAMAKEFSHTAVHRIEINELQTWFDKLSGHAQRARRAEFRGFFNHLIKKNLCPQLHGNPFITDFSGPQIVTKPKPAKRSGRLSIGEFWAIHAQAGELGYPFLQIAMGIGLLTTMRRSDICELQFDQHIVGGELRKQISKSHAQLSAAEFRATPSNLKFNLDKHHELKKLTDRARELSLTHRRCPHILSFKPKKRYESARRQHTHQVLPDYLTRAFNECRDATGLFNGMPSSARPPFREIRALSSHLFRKAGYKSSDVQVLMAHTDEKITRYYQSGHETHWTEIEMSLPAGVIMGDL